MNVGGIAATSVEFATFFENNQLNADGGGLEDFVGASSSGVSISAAIDRYETSAKVIAGTNITRGESLNMNL